MRLPDVESCLRQTLDPLMGELGFRLSDDGYVRAWEGGCDRFGWEILCWSSRYCINGFAAVRLDVLEERVAFAPPSWSCNVTDLFTFVDGPGAALRPLVDPVVETQADACAFAIWLAQLVHTRIDPWWRSLRTPHALWNADEEWRRFWGAERQLREAALQSLLAG